MTLAAGSAVAAATFGTTGTVNVVGLNAIGQAEPGTADTIQVSTSNSNILSISGATNGVLSIYLDATNGYYALPTITGLQAGTATITLKDVSATAQPSMTFSVTVQPSTPLSTAAAQINGQVISSKNQLTVAANTPVTLTIANVDAGGNVVPVTSSETSGGTFAQFGLSDSHGGTFKNASGSIVTAVTIPVGQTTATVQYVNTVAQTISSGISATQQAVATASDTVAVTNPGSITVGTSANFTLTLKTAGGSTDTSYTGALPLSINGSLASPNGSTATLPSSAAFTAGVATVPVTLVNRASQTLTFNVNSGAYSATATAMTPSAASASSFTLLPATKSVSTTSASITLNATVTDQYGNFVADGTTVSLALESSPKGSLSSTSPTTTSGVATVTYTGPSTSSSTATDTVTATVSGATAIGTGTTVISIGTW